MSYTKHTWQAGESVTAEKLNNIETGIESAAEGGSGAFIIEVTRTYDSSVTSRYVYSVPTELKTSSAFKAAMTAALSANQMIVLQVKTGTYAPIPYYYSHNTEATNPTYYFKRPVCGINDPDTIVHATLDGIQISTSSTNVSISRAPTYLLPTNGANGQVLQKYTLSDGTNSVVWGDRGASVPNPYDESTNPLPLGYILRITDDYHYEWSDPSPGYFRYDSSINGFVYTGPVEFDGLESLMDYTDWFNLRGSDVFLWYSHQDEAFFDQSQLFRLVDVHYASYYDEDYGGDVGVTDAIFSRIFYDSSNSQTVIQQWTLRSINNGYTMQYPFIINYTIDPNDTGGSKSNTAFYSEQVVAGNILSYAYGGTGTNSLKTLSQKMFKQCTADGSDDLSVLTTYPVNKPGVYRVGQPNVTGLPTGITGYGCLVIFNGGSYWLHMYMDANNGIYFARKDSTAVPTTWYKATTSSVAAKT